MSRSTRSDQRSSILRQVACQIVRTFVVSRQRVVVFNGTDGLVEYLARQGGACRCNEFKQILREMVQTLLSSHEIIQGSGKETAVYVGSGHCRLA